MEGRKPGLVVSWVAPILSGCHHPVGGEGRSRGAGAEALRVRFELILFSLGAHFPLSWQQHLYPRGELRPSSKGLIGCLVWARAGTGMVLAQQSSRELLITAAKNTSKDCPHPVQMKCRAQLALSPSNVQSPWQGSKPSPCPGAAPDLKAPGHTLGQSGTLARALSGVNLFLPPFRAKNKHVRSSQINSRCPTALLLAPLGFRPAKETHLFGVRSQG